MSDSRTTRSLQPDLIRAVALYLVLSVHFFLYTEFYEEIVQGAPMYIMVLMRSLFIGCVPMFLMLTGYLAGSKRPSWRYFLKAGKTLTLYVLAAITCVLFRAIVLKEAYSPFAAVAAILDFSASDYGWYVEMYLGLFLLTPFLTVLYSALKTETEKHILILSLLGLTCLPIVLNYFNFGVSAFWRQPASIDYYSQLVPGWWVGFFPVTYFMLGAYLKDHKTLLTRRTNLLLLAAAIVLSALYNCYRSAGSTFIVGPWCDWGSLQATAVSFLLFHLLLNLDLSRLGKIPTAFIQWVARISFCAYLLSWATDSLYYPILETLVPVMQNRLPWYFIIVPVSFLTACAASQLLWWIYRALVRITAPLLTRITAKIPE